LEAVTVVDNYVEVTPFRAYHTARGRDTSQWLDPAVIAAGLVASEWLDGSYRASFPGTKVGYRAQVREWPRTGADDADGYAIASDSVPQEMYNAAYEATYRELTSPGSLLKDYTPGKYKRASVDGAVSVEYATFNAASDIQTQFAVIDQILAPILTGEGNLSSLSGAVGRK
jgi:hypothetical protein